jgi:hypothetical protein
MTDLLALVTAKLLALVGVAMGVVILFFVWSLAIVAVIIGIGWCANVVSSVFG